MWGHAKGAPGLFNPRTTAKYTPDKQVFSQMEKSTGNSFFKETEHVLS